MREQRNQVLNIAHRGASGEAPENTLAAFQLGIEQGCDAIELDVHLSADGELIVCHDYTINRTTNDKGKIAELTKSQLKQVDAGLWFHEKFAGERLPLLEEVFAMVPAHIMINVEIKAISQHDDRIEKTLISCMKNQNCLEQVVVSCFDHPCMERLKRLEPDVKIGLLYSSNLISHQGYAGIFPVPVYSLHPQHAQIPESEIRDAVRHGLQVYAWTVDQAEQMKKLITYGVNGIITNYPTRMAAVKLEMGV